MPLFVSERLANTFWCFPNNLTLSAFCGAAVLRLTNSKSFSRAIINDMHVAAVRNTGAQKPRWISDTDRLLTCEECGVQYSLYCDNEAVGVFTRWSLLAQEIITARHPHHPDKVILDWIDTF